MRDRRQSALPIRYRASPNHGPRKGGRNPDLLVLHYTATASAQAAERWLCHEDAQASAHYLVDLGGAIVQMVGEDRRAWHAGQSHWAGETDINSCSIGIEIHNVGHETGYPEFPEPQMAAVEALCLDILSRHEIPPRRVLAHSDIAPMRKADPGEKFDWSRLHRAGIGHWVAPAPLRDGAVLQLGDEGDEVAALQSRLRHYGYGIETSGLFDARTRQTVVAFQRHFRPARVDGLADVSTRDTLERLIEALPEN